MTTTITIHDRTVDGADLGELTLEFLTEHITARELIRSRVYQEVTEYNARRVTRWSGLVQPAADPTGPDSNGAPGRINWEAQFERALRAFNTGRLLIIVDGFHAKQHEVRAERAELGREHARGRKTIQRRLALEQDRPVGTHRQSTAQLLTRAPITEADDDHFPRALAFLQPKRSLQRKLIVWTDDVFDAGGINRLPVTRNPDPRLRIRHALDADDDLHCTSPFGPRDRFELWPIALRTRANSNAPSNSAKRQISSHVDTAGS